MLQRAAPITFRRARAFICTCVGLLISGSSVGAQVLEAVYEGDVRTGAGEAVPFRLNVWKAENDRSWSGSFILSDEAGPYVLKSVKYDEITHAVSFEYYPPK